LQSGKVQVIGHGQDGIAKHFIVTGYFCSGEYAAKNADVLARFRKGLYEAAAYANANRAEMVPLLAKYSGVDAKIVAAMTPTTVGVAGQLDPRMIQPMLDVAIKYKVITTPFPAKDMIDPNALSS
jgi:ABC-type nitrate/sulfonate/bicarbonate transport system substrate-binding protein